MVETPPREGDGGASSIWKVRRICDGCPGLAAARGWRRPAAGGGPRLAAGAGLAAPRGGRRSGEPGHVTVQGRVTDEGTGVDERVRDDHRGHPAPPAVQHAEDDAQDRVAEEPA